MALLYLYLVVYNATNVTFPTYLRCFSRAIVSANCLVQRLIADSGRKHYMAVPVHDSLGFKSAYAPTIGHRKAL